MSVFKKTKFKPLTKKDFMSVQLVVWTMAIISATFIGSIQTFIIIKKCKRKGTHY